MQKTMRLLLMCAAFGTVVVSTAAAQTVTIAPVATTNPCAGVWLTNGWMLAIDSPLYVGDGTEVPKGKRALKAIIMKKAPDGSVRYDDWFFIEQIDSKSNARQFVWPLKNNGFAGFKCENGILIWAQRMPDGSRDADSLTKMPSTSYQDIQSSR